jgi:hypothetical protein
MAVAANAVQAFIFSTNVLVSGVSPLSVEVIGRSPANYLEKD